MWRGRRSWLAILTTVGVVAGGAFAFGAIPDAGKVYTGCYNSASGALRVIDKEAGATCASGERQIQWNQKGPTGPKGPAGAKGPTGPRGTAGPTGPVGPASSGGGVAPDVNVKFAQNCTTNVLASRSLTLSAPARVYGDATVKWTSDDSNHGSATLSVELVNSAGTVVASNVLRDAHTAGPLSVTLSGLLSTDGAGAAPYGAPKGTYTLRVTMYPFGTCAQSTYVDQVKLSYLRVGNSD
jgi:hypothetical protein